jgi:hypothetical protein
LGIFLSPFDRSGQALLLLLHRFAAAADGTVATLGDDHFRPALGALVSLAYLVRH